MNDRQRGEAADTDIPTSVTMPHTPDQTDLDQMSRSLVASMDAGEITERDVRNLIAVRLVSSRLASQTTGSFMRYRTRDHQLYEDLVVDLKDFIFGKALDGPEDSAAGLSLESIRAGSSVTGWARKLMFYRLGLIYSRKLHRRNREMPNGDFGEDWANLRPTWGPPHGAPTDFDTVESQLCGGPTTTSLNDAVDLYHVRASRSRNVNGPAVVHAASAALALGYNVPTPPVIYSQDRAKRLREKLDADPLWAKTQLVALAGALDGEPTWPDQDLYPLAGHYTPEQLRVLGAHPKVASTIVLASATPRPPIPGASLKRLRAAVEGMAKNRASGVFGHVRALVSSYDALHAGISGHEWNIAHEPELKSEEQRLQDRVEFEEACQRAVACGFTELGHTPPEIERSFARILTNLDLTTV